MSSQAIPILLLKTRSTPADKYDDFFTTPSPSGTVFSPTFIPVLRHVTNIEPAVSFLTSPETAFAPPPASTSSDPQDPPLPPLDRPYGGLIFTSQRAVEAFAAAFSHLDTHPPPRSSSTDSDTPAQYTLPQLRLPIYVPGPATAEALRTICSTRLPNCSVLGEETDNGDALAAFISTNYYSTTTTTSSSPTLPPSQDPSPAHQHQQPRDPLLFLVGEQRRDIIPRTLQSATTQAAQQRVRVDERVVYETSVEPRFEEDFAAELQRAAGAGVTPPARPVDVDDASHAPAAPVWVVVFSPTGCEAMLRVLGWRRESRDWTQDSPGQAGRVRVATIGPTTRDHLVAEFGFEPDACAAKPSPQGVREAIERGSAESL